MPYYLRVHQKKRGESQITKKGRKMCETYANLVWLGQFKGLD